MKDLPPRLTPYKGTKRLVEKSKYQRVSIYRDHTGLWYKAYLSKTSCRWFREEREAALFVDKHLISKGLAPVNILKPKQ